MYPDNNMQGSRLHAKLGKSWYIWAIQVVTTWLLNVAQGILPGSVASESVQAASQQRHYPQEVDTRRGSLWATKQRVGEHLYMWRSHREWLIAEQWNDARRHHLLAYVTVVAIEGKTHFTFLYKVSGCEWIMINKRLLLSWSREVLKRLWTA